MDFCITGKPRVQGLIRSRKEKVGIREDWDQLEGIGSLIGNNNRGHGRVVTDKPWRYLSPLK